MKKLCSFWMLLLPAALLAQVEMHNGAISIDFGKKKNKEKQENTDTTGIKGLPESNDQEEDEDQPKAKKEKKTKPTTVTTVKASDDFDPKQGIFKGIFHLGLNAAQIDGDRYAGYNYPGLDVGVGTQIRFHKYFSTSIEINYSMKGAKQAFYFRSAPQTLQKYQTQQDYVEVPITVNVQDKKYAMFSLGLSPGVMVRFKQRDEQAQDITDHPFPGPNQPNKFDLEVVAAMHFFIKQQFGIGLKFAYSLIKLGGPTSLARINGLYNNVLTIRFMYILDPVKLKKKK